MIILAIETSCDETCISITNDRIVLSNVTVSQIIEHSEYGGIVPSLAAKLHLKNIGIIFEKAIRESGISVNEIEYVAYTNHPGLVICLQIGKIFAETISLYLEVPLIPCNHLIGHAYASLINNNKEWLFPALSLIISGGHTQLYIVRDHLDFEMLGETTDDAIGEFFDKSAIVMGYKYPGGPVIEKLAASGNCTYELPFPKSARTFDFSFSGLKSEVKRIVSASRELNYNDLSASILNIVSSIILKKIKLALKQFKIKSLVIGGGVIANGYLREKIEFSVVSYDKKIKILMPKLEYSTDNASMIAILAYYQIINNKLIK